MARSSPDTPVVAVVITVHNRRELTLRCLDRLEAQRGATHELRVYLTDDGSTDGTADAVHAAHPDVEIVPGDGSLFWNGGMRRALERAMLDQPPFYLLLNDDTLLQPGALATLLRTHDTLVADGRTPPIVVGAVRDPATGVVNYSGQVRGPWSRPMSFRLIPPGGSPRLVDTFDGNCVLVPAAVVERIGNLDPAFTHAMGDYDYGLRAGAAGHGVWVAPGVLGECESNPGFVASEGASVRQELARWRTVKHLPPAQWKVFTSRWAGPAWPVFYVSPYARRVLTSVRARSRSRA